MKEGGGQDKRGETTEGAWVWAKGSDVLVTMMGRVGLESITWGEITAIDDLQRLWQDDAGIERIHCVITCSVVAIISAYVYRVIILVRSDFRRLRNSLTPRGVRFARKFVELVSVLLRILPSRAAGAGIAEVMATKAVKIAAIYFMLILIGCSYFFWFVEWNYYL